MDVGAHTVKRLNENFVMNCQFKPLQNLHLDKNYERANDHKNIYSTSLLRDSKNEQLWI